MIEESERMEDARAAALLRRLPMTPPAAERRVRARVVAGPPAPVRQPWWVLLGTGVGGGALVTALAMLVIMAPDEEVAPPAAAPAVVAATLASAEGWSTDTSIDGVALSFEGTGEIGGTAREPRIRWESGTINVEVTPNQGIHLAVVTRDAEVRVVGTGFSVSRDALGTRVEVRHGKVEVDCGDQATVPLGAGDSQVCLPRSAGTLLGRATALKDGGAPATEVLDTLDRGLALVGEQEAVRDELSARRVATLFDLGRSDAGLEAARAYLSGGGHRRRADILRLAVNAAGTAGGCAKAAPWLLEMGPDAVGACK